MKYLPLIVAIFAGLLALYAQEQEPGPLLQGNLTVSKVLVVDGQTKLEALNESAEILPGDILLYELEYINVGNADAENGEIISPLSDGTTFIPGTEQGKNFDLYFSTDNGQTYAQPPITRTEVNSEGEDVKIQVEVSEYTHIKFLVREEIKPGKSFKVSYQVKVNEE
ncbi:hypothetical protein JW877_07200 [bacterium]|nr:hypothetical protein [bacterium]